MARPPPDREGGRLVPVKSTPADEAREAEVADLLAEAFDCEIWPTPTLAVLDFVAGRDGRLRAVGEIKCRGTRSDAYPRTFIDVSKWEDLRTASTMLRVPALFVVRFTDRTGFIDVEKIEGWDRRNVGRTDRSDMPTDVHPAIAFPVADMRFL